MPGFTIHIAIAKQYAKKHKDEIKNVEIFEQGAIAPDYLSLIDIKNDKSKTHYGKWGKGQTETHIDVFLKDEKVNIEEDYWKGYFIHLLTDHYFYNRCFRKETDEKIKNNDDFYYDYDCLNKVLLKKYNIKVIEKLRKYMNCIDGQPKYLEISKILKFIEDMSNINMKEQIELIRKKGSKSYQVAC